MPSGYLGEKSELTFMRVFPEPYPEFNLGYDVVATTPYVLVEKKGNQLYATSENDWLDFINRNLPKLKIRETNKSYEFFLRYGLNRHYWNEFIFQGYSNHSNEMILLAGMPDVKSSLPHPSKGNPF